VRHQGNGGWEHPWLRIERVLRSVIGDRMSQGPNGQRDLALAVVIQQRKQIEREGWFN